MTSTAAATPDTAPANPPAQRTPNRRGRGRGGHTQNRSINGEGNDQPSSERGRGRGGRRGGRGGRGRGGLGPNGRNQRSQAADGDSNIDPSVPPPPNQADRGSFGARLTGDANGTEGEGVSKGKEAAAEEDDDDSDVCFICASPVVHSAVSPCNHRTCHICALRLRALYKTKACAHCRTVSDFVILTDEPEKRYEEYTDDDFATTDTNLGIKYEKAEIFEDTVLLLRYNCPDPSCDVACLGWPDLHAHVKSVHHKVLCDLCTRHKKVFTHEHELFTYPELRKHQKFGDDNPGAVDQTGFKGHPECGFCRQRFYGDDELYTHCRDRHEKCFICERRNPGKTQYYLDYNALEEHFRKDHFLCPDQECLEKKFVVFDSKVDLQAHQLQDHPNGLNKGRDARRVDMSSFDYRRDYQSERADRRREPRGRGRDPNSEPLPVSSAQPMRRDEVAFQRQVAAQRERAVQTSQSVAPRTFGGQLTSTETYAARPTGIETPPTVIAPRPVQEAFPSLSSFNNSLPRQPSPPSAAETPAEQARRLRHAAVTERAANLLGNDQTKLTEFRSKVSAFKNGGIQAPALIDAFFALFDTSSAELGKLIKELADIFEITSKKDALLKAWNDWKAINEDYPGLPAPSAAPAGTSTASIANWGGSRVLKLKSSTAQSSRARPGWGSAGSGPASSSPFPPLAPAKGANPGRAGAVPWAGPATTTASRASPATAPIPPRAAPTRKTGQPSADAFPALPAAAKPAMPVLGMGYGNTVIRREKGPASNAWESRNGASSSSAANDADADEPDGAAAGRKKGNRNKKQTLFHFG